MMVGHNDGKIIEKMFSRITIVLGIIYLGICIYGMQADLPYAPWYDEPIFVNAAVTMASTGDLNPRWFGNPGSTTIYPLALLYHLVESVGHGEKIFNADPTLFDRYATNVDFRTNLFLIGRALSIFALIASLPFLFLVGRSLFNKERALTGLIIFMLYPTPILYSGMIRTDTVGIFFLIAGFWTITYYYSSPTWRRKFLAVMFIGLGVSTRYFLVTLLPVLLLADIVIWKQKGSDIKNLRHGVTLATVLFVSIMGSLLFFFLTSPYVLLDFAKFRQDLIHEARPRQLGKDGLNSVENFLWYLRVAIPQYLTWPHAALAALGLVITATSRRALRLLFITTLIVFLIVISLPSLHWERWTLQLLPFFSLLVSHSLWSIWEGLSDLKMARWVATSVQAIVIVLCFWPLHIMVDFVITRSTDSPQVATIKWIEQNVPLSDSLVVEPLFRYYSQNSGHQVYIQSWFPPDMSPSAFAAEGYDIIVVDHRTYETYQREEDGSGNDDYGQKAALYEMMIASPCQLATFPALSQFSRTMSVFDLSCLADFEGRGTTQSTLITD
jgi:4-amino-4-deoxy-L-arabinose transferase-like glycosyltransferase